MRPAILPLFAVSLLLAGGATAQTTPSAKQACMSSAKTFCHHEVSIGARSEVRACLIRNFDKVAPECQAAMKAVQAREMATRPDTAPPKP